MPQTDTTTSVKTRTAVKVFVAVALTAGAIAAAAGIVSLANRPFNKPFQPLTLPTLTVSQIYPPNSGTYVKGSDDVDVLGVSFSAAAETTVTGVTFNTATDDDGEFVSDTANDVTVAEHVNSCTLYDRTSGAVLAGPEPPDAAGAFAFTSAFTVSATLAVSLKCDFTNISTQSDNNDIYAFMVNSAASVTAEDTDGNAIPTSKISVGGIKKLAGINTSKKVTQTIMDSGTLTIATDTATPSSAIVLGNSTDVQVGKWAFRASGEAFEIDTLTFVNSGNDNAIASVTLVCPDVNVGSTLSSTSYLSGGRVAFNNTGCVIPEDDPQGIYLLVDTNSVGPTGASSGTTFSFALDGMSAGAFKAIGMASGETLTEGDVASLFPAKEMVLRKTKPTFSLASGSPSGAGVPGLNEVLRFNVSADSHGDVELEQIIFKIISTDNSGSGWSNCGDGLNKVFGNHARWALYDTDDLSTPISDEGDWSLLTSSGAACGQLAEPVNRAVLNLGADLTTDVNTVSAGSTKTFVLKVDTTGASAADDDSIRFSIANETATGNDAILWSDGYATDIDGTYVKNLPVTGGTIVY